MDLILERSLLHAASGKTHEAIRLAKKARRWRGAAMPQLAGVIGHGLEHCHPYPELGLGRVRRLQVRLYGRNISLNGCEPRLTASTSGSPASAFRANTRNDISTSSMNESIGFASASALCDNMLGDVFRYCTFISSMCRALVLRSSSLTESSRTQLGELFVTSRFADVEFRG